MNTPTATEPSKPERSVYEEAEKAASDHRWWESERAGRDVGPDAVREWSRAHWLRFYRYRFVQHLRGEAYFREFHPRTFAIVNGYVQCPRELLDAILNQVRDGAENLDIICWAQNRSMMPEPLLSILEAIDINRQRLRPFVE
jgi:hypothetical protein